jgi:energy-coupling factor transporter ATP-binding protein EcfA2
MSSKTKEITKYFRSAVAAQSNMSIDFKKDDYQIILPQEVLRGELNLTTCEAIFADSNKDADDSESKTNKKTDLHVIICAKAIKTLYSANTKIQDEIEELTGVFYIPAILNRTGKLAFNDGDKNLPWFPREYLQPMVDPKLAIGYEDTVDTFVSDHVDQVEKIASWSDYAAFFQDYYEAVSESKFEQTTIRNMDRQEAQFELEDHMYVFRDNTVMSTYHILKLYNHLQDNDQTAALYETFVSMNPETTVPLVQNDVNTMQVHCGQMGGGYPLSPSQREVMNHFNAMKDGEILAVNGPPGTGKTTLLQSIVADMYVKRAINQEKAPLIVASSTNNQAVTNIIDSFGKIETAGIANLEERWIEGVNSFAVYFPSGSKEKEALEKGYQYTNQKGEFFVSNVDTKENLERSKSKLIQSCNVYFETEHQDITACQNKLHEELLYVEKSKNTLLSLVQELSGYDLNGQSLEAHIDTLEGQIADKEAMISGLRQRVHEWEVCYQRIPFLYRMLRFIGSFSRRIQTEFRLFINEEEQDFINEYMSLTEIKDKYSYRFTEQKTALSQLKEKRDALQEIKKRYDGLVDEWKQHHIILHKEDDEKYKLDLDFINDLLDKKVRYVEFWLAVHYFECRWANGEDTVSEKQKGRNFENVLGMFYNRLSMLTPCLVMTFFMLPKQFLAFGDNKQFFLYNYIDLLIVDEAGQVSPEIAAGAFSLAKKAIVVGDIFQIEPVWSVNRALDKALALSNGVIESLDDFAQLEQNGLNSSRSSVMRVAAKSCKYEKFGSKGLFLSEHRRCYDEIIEYCNELIYGGNLQPMRGLGKQDKKLAIKQWPHMGCKQIQSEHSTKKGSSRLNRLEAEQIAAWVKSNFTFIEAAYQGKEENKENLIGIITPFKAQANCIKAELKKQIPQYASFISVGTIHTFQGADRRIVILSTVYGSQDGCFFIDANKSLMNVAVSRAKDHFFVFGDINCLKDDRGSASGLLKRCVGAGGI